MRPRSLKMVFLGLSITSSWGNGHATTYRGLIKGLTARGHQVLFLERDQEWYAGNRDMPEPPYGETQLYQNLPELMDKYADAVRSADFVLVGSYVPQGGLVGDWVTQMAQGVKAFYDIDTPVTLAGLERGDLDYLTQDLISRYDLYLSFTGGPTLDRLARQYGSPCAKALYCSVDPTIYFPEKAATRWDLGYLGTYSSDRQPGLEELLIKPARRWSEGRFIVAGPQYPENILWPANTERITHLSPAEHRDFYSSQRFTLNLTRQEMIRAGYSPSVRLFEAAACATPLISDYWDGLDTIFELGEEVLIARSAEDTLHFLLEVSDQEQRAIGERARQRVLSSHTAAHRAAELERYVLDLLSNRVAV